jgi:hypothetical protein
MRACSHGWFERGGTCLSVTTSSTLFSHAECVERCGLLNATLACITSAATQDVARELAAVSGMEDVWAGRYLDRTTSPPLWDQCVSGEQLNASFVQWAPEQPNAASTEHCVALWAQHDFRWRDAPCSHAARCLCERSDAAVESVSARYVAFATAEKIFHKEQLHLAYTWLLIAYLLVVPTLTLAPILCLRLCSRRNCETTKNALASNLADKPAVMTLHTAEQAQRQWTRISGSLIMIGMFSFWFVTIPQTLAFLVSIDCYRAVKLVMGTRLDLLSSLVPWSLSLLALAIRPTDAVGVSRACNALAMLLCAAVLTMAAYIAWQPVYATTLGTVPVWTLLMCWIIIVLLLLPATSCSLYVSSMLPREQLERFWLCWRTATVLYSVFCLLCILRPLLHGERLVYMGSNDIQMAFLVASASCGSAAITFTKHRRGRFQMWLGSHLFETRGSQMQEASFIAGLLRGVPAADVYVKAKVWPTSWQTSQLHSLVVVLAPTKRPGLCTLS